MKRMPVESIPSISKNFYCIVQAATHIAHLDHARASQNQLL